METVLQLQSLSKRYGRQLALDRVTCEIPKGRIVGILGPNGSGKTTLLKLIAGLLTPSSGSVSVCGQRVGTETKALVSYLPDRTYFRNNQTVRQQLQLFEDFYPDFDRQRAQEMLLNLGIGLNSRFGALSKGNKEKVQLVVVMSRRAKLYLLDEPIGGVDPATRDYILHTIVHNFPQDAAVVISTHLIADVEPILTDYLFLNEGRILQGGEAEAARQAAGKSLDAQFREVFQCLPSC